MKQAKDLMTKNPKTIGSGDELADIVRIFIENGVHYCPVVTPSGEVLGLLSEYSLVVASLRHALDREKHDKVYSHRDILVEAVFVEENSNLDEIVKQMNRSKTSRVLVNNPRGVLVGIISPRDILNIMHGETRNFKDFKKEFEKKQKEAETLTAKVSDLNSALAKYQKIYEEIPYPMHSADAAGKIVMANKKLHDMLGYDTGELLGIPVTKLYSENVRHEVMNGLERIKVDGEHNTIYTTMVTKKGEKIRVDLASSALKSDSGKFVSTITVARRINSEILLRALHGVEEDKEGIYADIKNSASRK